MQQYIDLLKDIIKNGETRPDRTGTGTVSVFGRQLRFNLQDGFPLLTTKRVYINGVIHELLWFLEGDTNTKYLVGNNVHIWDEWATESGDLGPVYGSQWRAWGKDRIDQIDCLVRGIKKNPYSRRHIVSAWNVDDLPDESISPQDNVRVGNMALAPCHMFFQFYVHTDGRLSCHMGQRSADAFLGVPFNIASYAILTHMVAQQCDLIPGVLVVTFGDVHLYRDHIACGVVDLQLSRTTRPLPTLKITRMPESIFDYVASDFSIIDYNPWPAIKANISV